MKEQIQISRALDPLALSVLSTDKKATAVYLVTSEELARYYPKGIFEPPPGLRITEEVFYSQSVPSANPDRLNRWTPVYDDPAGHGLMVSAVAPVYTNTNGFIGVIGIDFSLRELGNTIEAATLAEGSYSFLVALDA